MANETLNTVDLTAVINKCFANAIDERFTVPQQNQFMVEGKRLRGQLLSLLTAQFDAGTAQLNTANDNLSAVNDTLADDAATLANVSAVITQITTLVTSLDNLLSAAVSFV